MKAKKVEYVPGVGIDLSRTNIAEQARTLERNRKMLEIIKTPSWLKNTT